MEYYIAVFRARSETMNFASILKSYGVFATVINTPRVVNVSCGISVKFNVKDLDVAKTVLSRRRFDTFGGVYLIFQNGMNMRAIRQK